jgi:hypothetical protein
VYKRRLRVPYYVVFSRYTNRLRALTLVAIATKNRNLI